MSYTDVPLQRTPVELDAAKKEAQSYWFRLADEAIASLKDGISPIIPQNMLCKVPAVPMAQLHTKEINMGATRKALLNLSKSTMLVVNEGKCDVEFPKKEIHSPLLLGVQQPPVTCRVSGTGFQQWQVTGDDSHKGRTYLGVLSLAWAYILSTRLVEMQQKQGSEVTYTRSTATLRDYSERSQNPRSAQSPEIEIGTVDRISARWWTAILAPDQGWRAVVMQRNGEAYLAPWSVSLECGPDVSVIWPGDSPTIGDACSPPTSQVALGFLLDFCQLYDLNSEFYIAFVTTLTFPTHNYYNVSIELPWSITTRAQAELTSGTHARSDYLTISNNIPHYIALSCNYSVVMSGLCGSFWEPSVQCNLVSPWLHSVLKEIPQLPQLMQDPRRYYEVIATMSGIRRPSLSPLWVGAALSGLVPKVISSGTPPLDANGFPWTGSLQNFLDLPGSGPYFLGGDYGEKAIERPDVWRLLFLPVSEDDGLHYENLPFSPWEPVGKTTEGNCALRVRAHMSCSRHRLEYSHWIWQLEDGSTLMDYGFQPVDHIVYLECPRLLPEPITTHEYPNVPLSPTENASRGASWDIFQWVLVNHEGKPAAEAVYDDPWIAGCNYTDSSLSGSASRQAQITQWVNLLTKPED
ncbi:hypothetical protein BJX63DRAFT_420503 [Aspergillus granulosus]|uniref:Uncharacterized protein n=1 Tax=Aspergillus granulosus TaxID=176169 RepID=A0ABR4HIH6_9EURO